MLITKYFQIWFKYKNPVPTLSGHFLNHLLFLHNPYQIIRRLIAYFTLTRNTIIRILKCYSQENYWFLFC